MIKVTYGGIEHGAWNPREEEILLPTDPYYKERAPMVFAHELGHWKYEHTLDWDNPLVQLCGERDAWRFALSKLPPEEVDLDLLEDTLDSYVSEVEQFFGQGAQLELAKKIEGDLMKEAKRRKRQ